MPVSPRPQDSQRTNPRSVNRRTFLVATVGTMLPVRLGVAQGEDAFCRKYLRTSPRAIDSSLVTHVPVRTTW